MKVIAPSYYNKFLCKASACRHSCCVGWEVDIDDDTLSLYDTMTASVGEIIRSSIDRADEPHFKLDKEGRCPHLSVSGLCNIITECGEGALCQICRDHPRYRNFYDGVTELGLGLSCEEAVRLALSGDNCGGFWVADADDMVNATYFADYPYEIFPEEDKPFSKDKNRLLSFVTNRNINIEERLSKLLQIKADASEIKTLLLSLEILDPEWKARIELISAEDFRRDLSNLSICIEKILSSLIFRHLNLESFYSTSVLASFVALSAEIVVALSKTEKDISDALRAYSAEIEYSTENKEKVLDFIEEKLVNI